MAEYKLLFRRSVAKDLRSVLGKDLEKILRRIQSLVAEPRPPGCEKLTGEESYRIRQGACRIIYTVNDKEIIIVVIRVAQRGRVYRGSVGDR